jgi:hypothetical protein
MDGVIGFCWQQPPSLGGVPLFSGSRRLRVKAELRKMTGAGSLASFRCDTEFGPLSAVVSTGRRNTLS